MEALVIGIMMDLGFFARFLYIKKHFYKTKGVANGNGYKYQYASEFIYGYKGHNYVCRVKKNIFYSEYCVVCTCWLLHNVIGIGKAYVSVN